MAEEKKAQTTQETAIPKEPPQEVQLSEIHILPGFMVRKRIDKDLGGLVQSIKGQGVMEPVVLRPRGEGGYQMVSGYRRMWAAEMAGKSTIPAIIHDMTLEEARQYARESNGAQKPPIPGKPVPPKEVPATPTTGKAPEDKSTVPGKEAPATPITGKAPEEKSTDAKATPTAPGKEAPATPATGKAPEEKSTATMEKPAAPGKEAPATPTTGKAPENKAPTTEEKATTPGKEATPTLAADKAPEDKSTATMEKPAAPGKEAPATPTTGKVPENKAPTTEEKATTPGKEATPTPAADKAAENKVPTTEEKPAAPGKEAPAPDKTPEDKTVATVETPASVGEKPLTPEKEAPATPPADKLPEPGETGKVPLSQVSAPNKKEEFQVNRYGTLFTATAETLMDEQDVYKPLQVKKNKSGQYELTDPRDAMLLAAAKSLNLPSITIQVQSVKAKAKTVEQPEEEKIIRVPLAEVHAFSKHKWRVRDNTPSMLELTASIRDIGVTEPLVVRPDPQKGGYEVISGHRRFRASELTCQSNVPIIVRNYDDDDAAIRVADCNLHRDGEEISLMERAFNLRMKYDARQRKMGRKAEGEEAMGRGDGDFAQSEGLSRTKLHQLMRLTELIPQLQEMVTDGTRLKSFNTIYELACLKPAEQTIIYAQIKQTSKVPTLEEVKAFRRGEDPDKPKEPPVPVPPTPAPPAQEPPRAPEQAAPAAEPPTTREDNFDEPPDMGNAVEDGYSFKQYNRDEPPFHMEEHGPAHHGQVSQPVPFGQIPHGPVNIMDLIPPKQPEQTAPAAPTVPTLPGQPAPSLSTQSGTEPPVQSPPEPNEQDPEPPTEEKDPDSAYNILIPGPLALSWFGRNMTPLEMKNRVMGICMKAVEREKEMKAQAMQRRQQEKKALPPPKRPQGIAR